MIFDVNTAYFEEHGGYDYACRFYEEVFRFAQKEYGPENILSAVMHADELNSALTEKLGYPVYHYHLHVVALPVVEKEVRYSKRCKDPELVGKVKEVIHQISHSKKWASQKVTDENGKSHLIKSYSQLQDRFFEHMRDAGFEDFERGERGSTAQHLSVTEFKVKQEQQRLADITDEKLAAIDVLDRLAEEEIQKQGALTKLEQQAKKAEKKLDTVVPVVQDAETFARDNISYFEDLIPEAGALESAKSFREKMCLRPPGQLHTSRGRKRGAPAGRELYPYPGSHQAPTHCRRRCAVPYHEDPAQPLREDEHPPSALHDLSHQLSMRQGSRCRKHVALSV